MRRDEAERNFGGLPMRGEHDVLTHARRAKKSGTLPAIRMDCGVKDFLLEDNRAMCAALTKARIPHTYHEFAGGHDWDYWDRHIRKALVFHTDHLCLLK